MNNIIYWTVGFAAGTLAAKIGIKEIRMVKAKAALTEERRQKVEDLVRPL